MRRIVDFIARILTAGVFVTGGWSAFREPGRRAKAPAKIGLPESDLLVRANGLGMVVAGTTMAVGIKPRLSALALAGMLIPTTVAAHRFWEEEDERSRAMQRTQFFKNAATLGALLEIASRQSTRTQRVPE
jgi:putative oxidoreductase